MTRLLLFCALCACITSFTLANTQSPKAQPSSQAKPKSTQAKTPAKSKPQAKKPKKKPSKPLPKLPAQSVLDSMAKKGELIDFGEENFPYLAYKLGGEVEQRAKDLGLRIAVFGDSHIAGDFIPRVLRERFMEVDSIGFAYPIFPAFHQNLLTHYQHKGFELINSRKDGANSYPLGGIIARAKQEGAFVKLSLNFSKDNQDFSTRFVFKAPSTLGAFVVKDSSGKSKRLGAKKADKWHISEPMSLRFPIHIESLLPNAMLGGYIISKKNDSYVINLGINGARSDIYLKWEQDLWQAELGELDLDLIILSYGSNDAIATTINIKLYKQNFAKLIRTLRKLQPKASILLLGAPQVRLKQKNGSYIQSKSYESVRQATKELAKDENTLYFDMQDFIDESGGKQKWITQALSKPDVHLTPYGYKLVAESLALHLRELAQKHAKHPSKKPKPTQKPQKLTKEEKEEPDTKEQDSSQESQSLDSTPKSKEPAQDPQEPSPAQPLESKKDSPKAPKDSAPQEPSPASKPQSLDSSPLPMPAES
ncbi:GDSL-type esterase/lipase family protein, partial [Helicobacter canis]|uniref:GDSL-type esterase/lipase family protein n=1 Tax=Helicobacter canis TaxID=29419 RepID=UPI0026F19251